jgi:endonuclease G, mitochondrial
MNIFPQLSEEQKRNTYKLPFTANAVKANQEIAYSHWDAESQCAEDVPSDQLLAVQKQFKSDGLSSDTDQKGSNHPNIDPSTQDAIVKQLVEALLQYILQLLR